jgi:hypothetical protein
MSKLQCSCCGKLDTLFGICPNCRGCGPEGRTHNYDEEVWSQEREDHAEAVLESAQADLDRIRKQHPADLNSSDQSPHPCWHCTESFVTREGLDIHKAIQHDHEPQNPDKAEHDKHCVCAVCLDNNDEPERWRNAR